MNSSMGLTGYKGQHKPHDRENGLQLPTLEGPDDADRDDGNGRCNSDSNQLLSIYTFDKF